MVGKSRRELIIISLCAIFSFVILRCGVFTPLSSGCTRREYCRDFRKFIFHRFSSNFGIFPISGNICQSVCFCFWFVSSVFVHVMSSTDSNAMPGGWRSLGPINFFLSSGGVGSGAAAPVLDGNSAGPSSSAFDSARRRRMELDAWMRRSSCLCGGKSIRVACSLLLLILRTPLFQIGVVAGGKLLQVSSSCSPFCRSSAVSFLSGALTWSPARLLLRWTPSKRRMNTKSTVYFRLARVVTSCRC